MAAIMECGHCKGFGGQHLAALLEPITWHHPWELLVGDYLSMPIGKGGLHTIALFMDIFLQKIFSYKFTVHRSTKTTISSLDNIWRHYCMPEVFMADGGTHFSSHSIGEWCAKHGSQYHKVAA